MSIPDPKEHLVDGLGRLNEQVLHKLDGLSEYDLRRPMTSTGTNLLGVVKHLASVQAGYFGETFGRPFPGELPFDDDDPQADLYATAEETSESIKEFYRASWQHALETFAGRDLDSVGQVPWWSDPEVSLHQILVHMTNETARHAGHIDIVRELIDGAVGRSDSDANIVDGYDWPAYVEKLEALARRGRRIRLGAARRTSARGSAVRQAPFPGGGRCQGHRRYGGHQRLPMLLIGSTT